MNQHQLFGMKMAQLAVKLANEPFSMIGSNMIRTMEPRSQVGPPPGIIGNRPVSQSPVQTDLNHLIPQMHGAMSVGNPALRSPALSLPKPYLESPKPPVAPMAPPLPSFNHP